MSSEELIELLNHASALEYADAIPPLPVGDTATIPYVNGQVLRWDDNHLKKEPLPDPRYVPFYTKEDVDKIVMMLTLWIPDLDIRNKLEEVYQCWKDTQK